MDSPSPLDHGAIERLRRLGDDTFVRSMIELFFSYVSQKLAEARRAWELGDLSGVGGAAHAIKSTAGNSGATEVQELAARVERAAKEGDNGAVEALLPQLEHAYAEVKPLLESEKSRLRDPGA